jgi:hypothetical protein
MSQENINIGSTPNAGDGDPLRTAFTKINYNFTELYANVATLTNSVTSVAGRTGNIYLTTQDIIGLNNYVRLVPVPLSSRGVVGHKINDLAFNSTYMYYCTATYTTGADDIWKRVSLTIDTW